MQSIQEKRSLVDQLAIKIGYHSDIVVTDKNETFVWNLIDFGYPEDNIIQGKCSIQASLDFNIDTWEKQIDADIIRLQNILKVPAGITEKLEGNLNLSNGLQKTEGENSLSAKKA